MIVASIIGWGFVVNGFAEDAPWNNWQGYLLGLVGGEGGGERHANLGVFFALVLSFVVTWFARADKVPTAGGGMTAADSAATEARVAGA